MKGPVGVALAQLIDAGAFTLGGHADQDAHGFAAPPCRGLAPPGEYFPHPVETLAPDKCCRLEFLADMHGYRLIYVFGHHTTPLCLNVCGRIIIEHLYYCQGIRVTVRIIWTRRGTDTMFG